ncbi:hypothetical protein [Taibaiella koreensis]|uniref:hypothetical protein n=1 Tax=Taibaiella koreensis TaxID=1268548 RepID=UPI000E59B155|nr:hypothetical protein [Taibaiella koreensis]
MKKHVPVTTLQLKKKAIVPMQAPEQALGGMIQQTRSPRASGPCGSCDLACRTQACRTYYCA